MYKWSPISADEWADPQSSALTSSISWTNVQFAERGDVAASGGHVGIVVAQNETVRAVTMERKILRNDWGFRAGQNTTFWRYVDN